MEKKNVIKDVIKKYQNELPFKVLPRNLSIPVDSKKIITLTGVRRCGKTSVLFDTINRLTQKGVDPKNILFLNFDDERLNLKVDEFDLILQAYREMFPEVKQDEIYIFFDEIQSSDGWEKFVRRIYDTETKNIFLSGSNSKMLATDIATSLRGKTLQFEIFPLSFREFCEFKKLDTTTYYSPAKAVLINSFNEYISYGGFPELVLQQYRFFDATLQEYYFVMLYKDLVERYNISNVTAIRYFVNRLLSNLSKPTSVNKIYNELKSTGLSVGKNFLYELIEYTEAIYMFFKLTRFDFSYLKESFADKKYYFIDNGLRKALQSKLSDDYGQYLENAVFLWLRREAPFQRGLHFYKGKKECDFVMFDRGKPELLLQVCYNFSETDTQKREIDGLIEASNYFNCDNLKIITDELETELTINNKTIKIVPAWKEMLENRVI